MDFIGSLLENSWLLLFLLFFLSNLFSSGPKKKEGRRAGTGENPIPERRPISSEISDIFEEIRRELEDEDLPAGKEGMEREVTERAKPIPRYPQVPKPVPSLEKISEAKAMAETATGETPTLQELEKERKRLEAILAKKKETVTSLKKGKVTPDLSNVTQGIIWSEILGPPRAKRPYGNDVYPR